MRQGRKSAAQTPSPKSDRIYGSKTNKAGSAASKESAKSIELSEKVVKTLKDKAEKYNETHKNDVSVNTLKAVFRRGSGAYSKSHRPTITGGAPNSRNAWSFARVNKFLEKKSGHQVKKAYVQDDDLMEDGGMLGQDVVCVNCGWAWNTKDSDDFDKYVCHKCGFDNTLYYSNDIMAKGGLLAPNGKKSNLTPEQYNLVRTPEFKAWFGDWENDPQNASKVVDENGEPLVVYHGTDAKFNVFDINRSKYGFFFTNSYDLALTYDKNVYQYFLNIRKPRKKDFKGANYDGDYQLKDYSIRNIGYDTKTFASISHSNLGYNGAIMKNVMDIGEGGWNENLKPSNIYVVFEPNQIKLADGTNTLFDANNPDIKYKKGGATFNDKELLAKWKRGESIGFTGISHLKAKGLIPRADGTKRKSEKYMEDGGLLKSLEIGAQNLNKNGIVLSDYDNKIIVIAYNSGNQERNAGLYNKALIYKSIRPIRQANEIIERLDNNKFENFDESKIDEYKKSNQLIILNQNEVLYDSENQDMTYKKGGTINKNFNMETIELTPSLTISDIDNKYPDVSHEYINKQVYNGIKIEMEHTEDPEVAKKIALDHLNESIHYYEELEKMEKRLEMRDVDEHYEQIKYKYAEGGEIKRTPSTDNSVWTAQYNVGDKVRIRVDMSSSNNVDKVFTIEKVEYVPPFVRTENPTGRLYILDEHGGSWEGKDLEYAESKAIKVAEESTFDEIFSFKTPSGERSRLTYIQQVLVRTSAFKNWFGDWELAANRFVADGKQNFQKHFKDVSKVIDMVTLEPRVLYHGTMSEEEFFTFDVTREKGVGRPYAYFSYNKPYAEHFTKVRQREGDKAEPHLYEVFLNVRHPFLAQGREYVDKDKNAENWLKTITGTIVWDRYGSIERDDIAKAVESTINNQVGRYVKSIYPSDTQNKFWKLMAGDIDKDFKYFLMAYDFDGVFYSEEFARDYDLDNPAQFTFAITCFDAQQIKLADARNTQFDPFNNDIRFEKGGKTIEKVEETIENITNMNKLESLTEMMAKGGKVQGDGKKSNDAKDGGYFVGNSHADGGIKAKNVDTDQVIEVEGNEVIINKRSVADTTKREFEGQMLTNREILSRINEGGGGVSFADGGEVKYNCGCSKKTYNFGGEILEESIIVNRLNVADPINESKEYLSNLMNSIYG